MSEAGKSYYQHDGHNAYDSKGFHRISNAVVSVTVLIPNAIRDFIEHDSYLYAKSQCLGER